jgi:hypothetical protein
VVLPGIIAFKLYGESTTMPTAAWSATCCRRGCRARSPRRLPARCCRSYNAALNSAAALYTVDIHLPMFTREGRRQRIGQRVQLLFMLVSLALGPLYSQAKSIIARCSSSTACIRCRCWRRSSSRSSCAAPVRAPCAGRLLFGRPVFGVHLRVDAAALPCT